MFHSSTTNPQKEQLHTLGHRLGYLGLGAAALGLAASIKGQGLMGTASGLGHLAYGLGTRAAGTVEAALPGVVDNAVRGTATAGLGLASFATGGDARLFARDFGGGHHAIKGFGMNPRVRSLVLGGAATYVLGMTASGIRRQSQSSYVTDHQSLEQRSANDLGATGSLALAMGKQQSREAMMQALIHAF